MVLCACLHARFGIYAGDSGEEGEAEKLQGFIREERCSAMLFISFRQWPTTDQICHRRKIEGRS
jgi:hypothetical protein